MSNKNIEYSIIIPCYKSSQTIGTVVKLITERLQGLIFEIILINDGSPDNGMTADTIFLLADEYDCVTAIDFSRNFGQHNAILCGFKYAVGNYIIVMDDDLQTHPSQINKLIAKINEGYDVVYANYPQKKHKWYRNLGSKFNSWSISKLIGKPKELRTSSFWICRKYVRDYVIQYKNANVFMPGLVLRITQNIGIVEVEHFERTIGESGYNIRALIKLWSNIIGFSVKPLRLASAVGFIFAVISLIAALAVIIRKCIYGVNISGWASTMVAICFFSGINLIFMGLIGEYIGRMFLDSGNQPQSVVKKCKEHKCE